MYKHKHTPLQVKPHEGRERKWAIIQQCIWTTSLESTSWSHSHALHKKPSPSFTHLIGPYSHSWALLWGPDVSCSTSTSEIMRSKCESCILLQRWCIAHLTAELLRTTGVFTFQARWDESANTCEVQTKEREKSAICNRWPELSSDAVTWPLPQN